ncbi:MAG TPA: metal ABC transporter permease [Halothiobacillus sp.]|nr:metal ABC transporter permease [Halothiobacillus sp.]
MDNLLFNQLHDPNVRWVATGALLIGMAAAVVGCFAFLRRQALIGDVLAHAALPGVTMAFFLTHSRDWSVLLLGALGSTITGWAMIEFLTRRAGMREDSALAFTLSFFFALGTLHLTWIQRNVPAHSAGLDSILFGQAAAVTPDELLRLGVLAILVLLTIVVLFDRLKLVLFDRQFALCIGMPVRFYELVIALLIVLTVVIGLQLTGVILMAALLLTPAAAARLLSHRLGIIVPLAGLFGAIAGLIGAQASLMAPRMPTGPWIAVAISLIFFASLATSFLRRVKRVRSARA